ncbi:DUF1844 domain-containing protein [Rhodohalobacter sp. SW132]|uniref:DUF1844 domain-containing protein n=1 Tax=Rhodohalobacter sp. SW132 TaxID=2293433 RepID=UPI000E25F118|nr:DUF1844 domain-containing protein [Rhodohalobacter sp. SW132]REL24698.1 DUF1844 domain-containing protein [Rhodohalobacter sp. SW132]
MSDKTDQNGEKLNEDQQQQLLFVMLIQQHEQIAMMGLGKTENPQTGKKARDLKSAKYAIDTIVMLEKYTKGNLPKEISGYVTETLNKLRLGFAEEKKKEQTSSDDEA